MTPLLGFPLLVYNTIIATVALTKFVISRGDSPMEFALALNAAQASMLGTFFGSPALWNPIYLQVPIFAPSLPARWGFTRLARVALASAAIAMTALVVIELPGAIAGIRSYAPHENDKLQEHPDGDFKLGLKIFPDLRSGPPPLSIENDLALADTLAIDALSVVINPEAARGVALDSLAKSIDRARSDSTILIVALGYPKNGETADQAVARGLHRRAAAGHRSNRQTAQARLPDPRGRSVRRRLTRARRADARSTGSTTSRARRESRTTCSRASR